MKFDSKNILITGASGFVGAVLLKRIVYEFPKARPYIILRKNFKDWRIKDVLNKVKVLEVDLTEEEKLREEVQKIKPSVIFHLAAYGAYSSQNSLEEAVKTNVVGTKNLLLSLEGINYQMFVNTGSSSEYGYKNHPMKETDFLEPASYYAATKAASTHLCTSYGFLNNRPIVTLRLFSVYGPYEEKGRFVPTAILSALEGKEINVVKGPKRDFVFVGDVVDAYFSCLKLKKFEQRIFNVCSGRQISIQKTAEMIVKFAESKSEIKVGAYKPRPWDTNYWVGSNIVTKNILKWAPKHNLIQGLSKSIEWFKINKHFYNDEKK